MGHVSDCTFYKLRRLWRDNLHRNRALMTGCSKETEQVMNKILYCDRVKRARILLERRKRITRVAQSQGGKTEGKSSFEGGKWTGCHSVLL